MRKVSSFSIGALAVLLLTVLLLGCGGGRSAPTGSNLKSMPAGTIDLNEALAELDALQAPEGVDSTIFSELKDSLRGGLINRGKIVLAPSNFAVNDFLEILPSTNPPAFGWSSNFFIADGDISGAVGVTDITPIAMFYNQKPSENPLAMVADYNRDDIVNVADITPLAQTFGQTTGGFTIEYSAADTGPWAVAGTVDWDDMLVDKNANGFAQWTYTFPTGLLANGDWFIRITPYDAGSAPGVPNTPVAITVGGGPVPDFFVTGIRITATNTTNTDASDTANIGTIRYVAPAGGGDTMGEAVANSTVLMDLDKVSYTWKGNPYGFDDPLPADLDQVTYDGYIAELKTFMSYAVESLTTPADPEAWAASATQPPTGYEGKLGPNDDLNPPNQDAVLFTAFMADNDLTQGASTFQVTVQIDLLADVNAPLIFDFQPPTQPQNKTLLHTVRFTFGADEVGDEVPSEVALYDKQTMLPSFTFIPAATLETTDPPTVPGEYTLQRFPGNPDFTAQVTILVAGSQLTQGINYVYRISEDIAGVNLRSSLKKPGTTFSVVGPQLFDMNTWPEEEFYGVDARQPYLYFVPKDPLIRRNPLGHRDASTPPEFVFDDPTAATDLVKATGDEFMIIYGMFPEPDSPTLWYKEGAVPPATIGDADGELPIAYRQPHLLAGLAGIFEFTTPGDVSFSMFSKEGTLLGSVTRILATMQIVRAAPVIGADSDFGVRPWGPSGDLLTPDFTDKVASAGANDVVVFSFYNLWLRHDDGEGLPEDQQGTHLLLLDHDSMAQLPDLLMRPAIMNSEYNGAPCFMVMDVSNPDWWQNISQPIPVGSYVVRVSNPGAGAADYPYDISGEPHIGLLTITP